MASASIASFFSSVVPSSRNPHHMSPAISSPNNKFSRRPSKTQQSRRYRRPLMLFGMLLLLLLGYRTLRTPPASTDNTTHHARNHHPHAPSEGQARQAHRMTNPNDPSMDEGGGDEEWVTVADTYGAAIKGEEARQSIVEDDPYDETAQLADALDAIITASGFDPDEVEVSAADTDLLSVHEKLESLSRRNKQLSLFALVQYLQKGLQLPEGFGLAEGEEEGDDPVGRWERLWKEPGGHGLEKALRGVKLGKRELAKLKGEVVFEKGWKRALRGEAVLVVFTKSSCTPAKNALKTLESFDVEPHPVIYDLDKRADGALLQSLLYSLTSRHTIPNILLNFETFGGADEVELLSAEGGLKRKLMAAGLQTYLPRGDLGMKKRLNLAKQEVKARQKVVGV